MITVCCIYLGYLLHFKGKMAAVSKYRGFPENAFQYSVFHLFPYWGRSPNKAKGFEPIKFNVRCEGTVKTDSTRHGRGNIIALIDSSLKTSTFGD